MWLSSCLLLAAACLSRGAAFATVDPSFRSSSLLTARPQARPLAARGGGGAQVQQSSSEKRAFAISGALGAVLVANRLLVPPELVYDSQSRSDLLGVIAIAGLVLTSLTSLDVTSREADVIPLEGRVGRGVNPALRAGSGSLGSAYDVCAWAAETLLDQTPAATIVLAWRGSTLLRQGVIPPAASSPPSVRLGDGPTARQASDTKTPVHLASLQALPGRVEFTEGNCVPPNAQSLLVLACGAHGTLVLAADRARAFTPQDQAAAFLLAQPVADALERAEAEAVATAGECAEH